MNTRMRAAFALVVPLISALFVAGLAAPASAEDRSDGVSPAATCRYEVRWDQAGVYAGPSHNTTRYKIKYFGDPITGPCATGYNEGHFWTVVNCDCPNPYKAGWMRDDALRHL